MARERQWKDRRAWVQPEAKKVAEKHRKRYPLWKRIIGFFVPKLKAKWRKKYDRYCFDQLRYIAKKMSHNDEKNDREEFARAKRQVARSRKRHADYLAKVAMKEAAAEAVEAMA
jgi:hypothetical protein